MNPRSPVLRSCMLSSLLAACQGPARENPQPAAPVITARDDHGQVLAELRPGHPCRATIGPVEMLIGGPPLVAQVGATHWSGEDRGNGTTLAKDGTAIARVVDTGAQIDVFDPQGVPLLHVAAAAPGTATVSDASRRIVRHVAPSARGLVIDTPPETVTGTIDATLAALLTARELQPEVRMLAACARVH